jgi:hypothetical protein
MRARMNRASELISHLRATRRGAARRGAARCGTARCGAVHFAIHDARCSAEKGTGRPRGASGPRDAINHEFRSLRHVARKRVGGMMIAIFFQFFFLLSFSFSFFLSSFSLADETPSGMYALSTPTIDRPCFDGQDRWYR